MCKSRLFLMLFVVAVVLHSILAQAQPKCSSIVNTKCNSDAECGCSGPRRFICNCQKECNRMTILEIMCRQRQRPCPNIFKKQCNTDSDCPCTKARYICENKECVQRPKPTPRPRSQTSLY